MTITLHLTTSEAEALMHKASDGPLSPQDERLLPVVTERLLGLYQVAYARLSDIAAQEVAFMAATGYVSPEDQDKFERLLTDPFGRDGLS